MSRISEALQSRDHRKLLVPFFTAGFPNLRVTTELVRAAEDAGADFVELGVPFSDPLADGPDIQFSSFRALQSGVDLHTVLSLVERIRRFSDIPLILMGYFNPVFAYGLRRYMVDAAAVGVDGNIIPDLPVEESKGLREAGSLFDLSSIFLVAPTSTTARIRMIETACTDFIYAVTVTGVTGAGRTFSRTTDAYLKKLRRILKRPFVAGFGVSDPAAAARLCRYADGVVIGSALVRIICGQRHTGDAGRQVGRFLNQIRRAI